MADYTIAELGSAPFHEPHTENELSHPATEAECQRFLNVLAKKFPIPDGVDAYWAIQTFSTDAISAGFRREVCLVYDAEHPESLEYATEVEDSIPEYWEESF